MIGAGTVRRKFGRLIFAIVFASISTSTLWVAIQKQFRIQKVEVVGAQFEVIIDEDKMNKNLLFFPAQKVRAQLLVQNPILKDIQIRKKFPHTIEIIAYARDPSARLTLSDHEVIVDNEGVVLGLAGAEHRVLPLLSLSISNGSLGTTIDDPNVRQSLAIVKGIGKDIAIISITNIDSTTLLAKTDRVDIYFPQNGETSDKVATLQTLISGFRIKGNLPKVIDLRFDKPIVTF